MVIPKWKDREGRPAEATEWHRIAVYGPAADAAGRLVRKGAAVLVEGRLTHREFRDREGRDRQIAEIVVAGREGMVNVLSPKPEADDAGGSDGPQADAAAPESADGDDA